MGKTNPVSVTCVIPAYNEAARIVAVLQAVKSAPSVGEILVVNDASTDETSAVVGAIEGVRLIEQPTNAGKSAAVARGIAEAQGEYVLLLDADLMGLDGEAIELLIAPVVSGDADISISLRGNSPAPWRMIGIDYISGERVMRREFLASRLSAIGALSGFGLEVYMNNEALKVGLRFAIIPWHQVKSPYKAAKFGRVEGLKRDAKMLREMFRTIPLHRAVAQIYQMKRHSK